jgi:uncharacterized protein YqgV (UPF0045/DUF77 family)
MKISIEISLYPLTENYEQVILGFIHNLHENKNLEIITNGLSTQVFGEFDEVMNAVNREMKKLYANQQAVLVMKMGRGELKY